MKTPVETAKKTNGTQKPQRRVAGVVARARLPVLGILALNLLWLAACATVPITGRSQLQLIPDDQINDMADREYRAFLDKHPPIRDTAQAEMVQRVGRRVRTAVERFFTRRKMADQLRGYRWSFNLVKSKDVNAWAMPGGKVVVYTGLFKVANTEPELAVVMAHEIAHAVARHGNERMSQGLLVEMGGLALSEALAQDPAATRDIFLSAYDIGTQVGALLPYSRLQESEADELGLMSMALAGYNPQTAVRFWQQMARRDRGGDGPEFLSTHPADETRIAALKKALPKAMKYHDRAPSGASGSIYGNSSCLIIACAAIPAAMTAPAAPK
jgi:predicted Zn-dependent protease